MVLVKLLRIEKWSGGTGVNIHSLPAIYWPQGTQSLVEDTSLHENRPWDIRSGLADYIVLPNSSQ